MTPTLSELHQHLNQPFSGTPDAPTTICIPSAGLRLVCTAVTPLACEILTLEMGAQPGSGSTQPRSGADAILTQTAQLTRRLQYLLEPLSAIEFDQEAATVLMRSLPPSEDEHGGRHYYELTVRTVGIALRRFHKSPRVPRLQVPMTLTREVLERLIDDCYAALQPEPDAAQS